MMVVKLKHVGAF